MAACEFQSFVILFFSIFLFVASFSGVVWNILAALILAASIWMIVFNFIGNGHAKKTGITSKAFLDFDRAMGGVNFILIISWLMIILNVISLSLLLAYKTVLIQWMEVNGVSLNRFGWTQSPQQQYILAVLMCVIALVVLCLFLVLGYSNKKCFGVIISKLLARDSPGSSSRQQLELQSKGSTNRSSSTGRSTP